jgi:hypothetical protein
VGSFLARRIGVLVAPKSLQFEVPLEVLRSYNQPYVNRTFVNTFAIGV